MKNFTIRVKAKSIKEAAAIEEALKDNVLRSTALIVGLLKSVDKAEQRRIMVYIADRFNVKL